jgi:hypothetical protein
MVSGGSYNQALFFFCVEEMQLDPEVVSTIHHLGEGNYKVDADYLQKLVELAGL